MSIFLSSILSQTQALIDDMRLSLDSAPLPLVADLSHWTALTPTSFSQAKAAGMVGVIYKVTQGTAYPKPGSPDALEYTKRRKWALDAGLLWADFHFGDDSNPEQQADWFLSVSGMGLKALDLERNLPQYGGDMTLALAERFVAHIEYRTGRYPLLYTNANRLSQLGFTSSSLLTRCSLWVASYRVVPTIPAGWKTWVFDQFTNGQVGPQPHSIVGIGSCDINRFNGTPDELKVFWRGEK